MRRQLDAEALGELGDPGELVGHGRDHRPPKPLHPPFEVEERAVALEVRRARQDEVRPADRETVEHGDRKHVLGLLGEGAHCRIGSRLVAGDHQKPDRLRVLLVAVGGSRPGFRDSATIWVAGR